MRYLVRDIIAGLKGHPLALVIMFLIIANTLTLRAVGESAKRRDAILADLVQHCIVPQPSPKKGDRE
jgi:hypothetical protein